MAGKPEYPAKLSIAADHMVMTADILGGGIVKNKQLSGDVDGMASTVRATLTSQLSAHVWLAGNALDTAVRQRGDLKDPQVVGAVMALVPTRWLWRKHWDRSIRTPRSHSSPPGGNTSDSS